jgi:hypothetical protein
MNSLHQKRTPTGELEEAAKGAKKHGHMLTIQPREILKLIEAVKLMQSGLEHIGALDRENRRDCCKFATLSGFRRRHLKEVARDYLTRVSEILLESHGQV